MDFKTVLFTESERVVGKKVAQRLQIAGWHE